jgi:hypothetical protein
VTEPILAYLDPGSTATILQLTIAGTAGIAAIFKLKWNSIKGFFSSRSGATDEPEKVTESAS